MTITKRLVLSHILTFFLPWLLFGAVILLSIGGLALFAMSGNKIYAETPTQFQRISMAVHHFAFQGIRDVERGEVEPSWVLELLDGEYNYFTLVRNGETIYSYGNPVLKKNAGEDAERAKAELADSPGGSTRYIAEGKNNYYMEKRVLDGVPCTSITTTGSPLTLPTKPLSMPCTEQKHFSPWRCWSLSS
jgi:hypothetical protein